MRLRRLVFRAHDPRWSFAPGSGAGAARHGGRFNPKGVPALYTSLRMETAWLEAQQAFPFKPQPLTICADEVDCGKIVNLSDPAVLAREGVDPSALSCAWEDEADRGRRPAIWSVHDALSARGAVGILVPSFAPGAGPEDVNAVFWRWSDEPPCRVRVIDDLSRLPRDDASWRA